MGKIKHFMNAVGAHYQNWQSKNFEKTSYGRNLRKYHNSHVGERCFIVANGPSLRASDLELIHANNEISFAMNRIYKIFSETKWRPTYYVCEDSNIFHEATEAIDSIPAKAKFTPINLRWYQGIKVSKSEYFFANYGKGRCWPHNFSVDISKSMDSMGTVTFTCINIAAYMGFKDIYLIGVDHNYHVTIDESGKTVVDDSAKDYFCDDYDRDIQDIVIHDMGQNTRAYCKAKAFCDENDIHVWNATRGGKLEVFPRVDFDKLFVKGK